MPAHPPAVAANAMVATSHPLATRAGLRMLERGGNAADAMLAAAAVLCVGEPLATGVGGDCFALVWKDGAVRGLDASGPAPRSAAPLAPVELSGPRSVTAPGAVAGWDELARAHARFGLDVHLADAIDAAENGVALTPHVGRVGDVYRAPELARTLRAIADGGPRAFYEGPVADALVAASWLEHDDLAAVEARWVEPLGIDYRGLSVVEMPPPTQGVAALEALGLLALGEPTLESQVECVRLALEDAFANVRDGASVSHLLEPEFLVRRRRETAQLAEAPAGTVYLCAVDADGMAVSFIQSLYEGRGPLAGDTGVQLQNRGAGFAVSGAVEPGRRPYHTIIPGMLLRDGALWGPFGVMGGFMQAQGHLQLVSALVDDGLDPQAALDKPRFRVDGARVFVEPELAGALANAEVATVGFGAGNAILVEGDVLVGGSDPRKDGCAAGF